MEQLTKLAELQSNYFGSVQKQSAEKDAGAFESLMQGIGKQAETSALTDKNKVVTDVKTTKAKTAKKSSANTDDKIKKAGKEAEEIAATMNGKTEQAETKPTTEAEQQATSESEVGAVQENQETQDSFHMQKVAEMQLDLAGSQVVNANVDAAEVVSQEITVESDVQMTSEAMQMTSETVQMTDIPNALQQAQGIAQQTAGETQANAEIEDVDVLTASQLQQADGVQVTAEEALLTAQMNRQQSGSEAEQDAMTSESDENTAAAQTGAAVISSVTTDGDMFTVDAPKTETMQTSPATLAEDLTAMLEKQTAMNQRSVDIELNPENLGKVLVRVSYELGRTVISIMASKQETLQLLSQSASQMGLILSRNTGEETTVVVAQQASADTEQQGAETETDARSQNRRDADEGQQKNKQNQSDTFLNMMRLGIM